VSVGNLSTRVCIINPLFILYICVNAFYALLLLLLLYYVDFFIFFNFFFIVVVVVGQHLMVLAVMEGFVMELSDWDAYMRGVALGLLYKVGN